MSKEIFLQKLVERLTGIAPEARLHSSEQKKQDTGRGPALNSKAKRTWNLGTKFLLRGKVKTCTSILEVQGKLLNERQEEKLQETRKSVLMILRIICFSEPMVHGNRSFESKLHAWNPHYYGLTLFFMIMFMLITFITVAVPAHKQDRLEGKCKMEQEKMSEEAPLGDRRGCTRLKALVLLLPPSLSIFQQPFNSLFICFEQYFL